MKKTGFTLLMLVALLSLTWGEISDKDTLTPVPEGAQAMSLLGKPLFASTPYKGVLPKYEAAKNAFQADPKNLDKLIWFGRWTAYKGDYREAIRIYSQGLERFPNEPRLYRHRGHRYISIREFQRAIKDFEAAAKLIKGKEDRVEADGQPNEKNIPISSLHSNIWYHLGLAYYLEHDFNNALRVYRHAVETSSNDDKLVSTSHWYYMILRLLGKKDEATKALAPIKTKMDVIENMAYHQLCLFYKGKISEERFTSEEFSNIMNDAVAYGLANWYFYNNQKEKAGKIYERILKTKGWASFGHIAAEADWVKYFKK